jgi:hypothetical protein
MTDPSKIDLTNARRVAYASSEADGRGRWTELSVWHHPQGAFGGKCWISQIDACSSREGERTKTRRLASASLARALEPIEDSDLGLAVKAAALEYAEDNGLPLRKPGRQVVPDGEREALAWLFGIDAADLSLRAAGKALGKGESTMRQALASGREVMVPLRSLLPFVDRQAFQAAVEREADRG